MKLIVFSAVLRGLANGCWMLVGVNLFTHDWTEAGAWWIVAVLSAEICEYLKRWGRKC